MFWTKNLSTPYMLSRYKNYEETDGIGLIEFSSCPSWNVEHYTGQAQIWGNLNMTDVGALNKIDHGFNGYSGNIGQPNKWS